MFVCKEHSNSLTLTFSSRKLKNPQNQDDYIHLPTAKPAGVWVLVLLGFFSDYADLLYYMDILLLKYN